MQQIFVDEKAITQLQLKKHLASLNSKSSHLNNNITEVKIKQEVIEEEEHNGEEIFRESDYLKDGISFNSEIDIKQEYITDTEEDETFQETYTPAPAPPPVHTPVTPTVNHKSKTCVNYV